MAIASGTRPPKQNRLHIPIRPTIAAAPDRSQPRRPLGLQDTGETSLEGPIDCQCRYNDPQLASNRNEAITASPQITSVARRGQPSTSILHGVVLKLQRSLGRCAIANHFE